MISARATAARYTLLLVWAVLAWLLSVTALAANPDEQARVRIDFYGHQGCSHCVAAKRYLDQLEREDPTLEIHRFDIGEDADALARLRALNQARGGGPLSVPAFVIGDHLLIGFRSPEASGPELARAIAADRDGDGPVELDAGPTCGEEPACGHEQPRVHLPWIGEVDPGALGLPLFTIVIAAIDGFNPCATWVLLFLLSLLVKLHDRGRILLIGGTFVLVSGLVYFAFMAAWLQLYLLIGISRPVEIVLGLLALFVATLDLKDFVAFGKGPSLSIPEQAKPTIYKRTRAVLGAHSTLAALLAASVLALLVNTLELLCTAGLPAVYTEVLSAHELSTWQRYGYLAFYDLVYMLDDMILLGVAIVTLRRTKLQEQGGRVLKLIAGLVMLVLGSLLLFAPQALSW